jgi:leader peptidase (prepilin peptidase) / N-methyltransferase
MAVPSDQLSVAAAVEPSAIRTRNVATAFGGVVLAAACFVRFGLHPEAFIGALFATVLLVLSVIDFERRIIPDRIVLPATAVVLAAQLAFFPDRAVEWVAATVGAALFFLLPLLVYPQGMGLGDVKLALFLGAGLGAAVVSALVVALLGVFLVACALLLRGGPDARRRLIPFGPFLAAGGLLALFFA